MLFTYNDNIYYTDTSDDFCYEWSTVYTVITVLYACFICISISSKIQ